MDVEQRTTITAGMNVSGVTTPLKEVGDAFAAMGDRAASANAKVSVAMSSAGKAALDGGRAFRTLANTFIDGYKEAFTFADRVQKLTLAVQEGNDRFGFSATILRKISDQYGLAGDSAVRAAQSIIAKGATMEQRLQAMQSILAEFKAKAEQPITPRAIDDSAIQKLAKEYVAGYGQATLYAEKIGEVQAAFAAGGMETKLYGDILDGLNAKFKITGDLARQAALAVLDVSSSAEQRQAALQSLINTMQGKPQTVMPEERVFLGASGQQEAYLRRQKETADSFRRFNERQGPLGQADAASPRPQAPPPDPFIAQDAARTQSRAADIKAFGDSLDAADRLRRQYGLLNAAVEAYQATVVETQRLVAEGFLAAAEGAEIEVHARDKVRASLGLQIDQLTVYQAKLRELSGLHEAGIITDRERDRLASIASVQTGQIAGAERSQIQSVVNDFAGVRNLPPQAPQSQGRSGLRQQDLEDVFGVGGQQDQRAAEAQAEQVAQAKALGDQLERDLRLTNQIYGASKSYEEELTRINALAAAGKISPAQQDVFTDQATQRFAAANQPLQSGPTADAMKAADAAKKNSADRVTALDRERRAIDPLYANSKRYEEALEAINRQEAAGNITATYATHLRDAETEAFGRAVAPMGKHTASLAQVSFATRQLGVQTVQTFQGFATGQPILTTLIQQGHQVVDVMLATGVGVRDMGAAFGRVFAWIAAHPFVLVITGIAAAIAAVATLATLGENAAKQLLTLQNTLRGTLDPDKIVAATEQVRKAARHLNSTTEISFDEAFQAGGLIRQNPAFQGNQEQLEGMIKSADELRQILGSDLPTATKILIRGFDDAAGAAEELRQKVPNIRGITALTVEQLKHTAATQGSVAAMEQFRKILDGVTVGGVANVTKLTSAWREFMKLTTGEGSFWHDVGSSIADGVAVALRAVNALLRAIQFLHDAIKNLSGSGDINILEPVDYAKLRDRARFARGAADAASGNNLVGLRPPGATEGFQTFAKPEDSIEAGIRQLQLYEDRDKLTTLRQQISKYAPRSENDTEAYIKRVAKETGIDPDKPYSTHDQEAVRKVITSMSGVESGKTVNPEIINRGVTQAFNNAVTGPSGTTGNTIKEQDDATKASEAATIVQRRVNLEEQAKTQRALDAATKVFDESYKKAIDAGLTPQKALETPAVKAATEAMIRQAETLDTLKGAYTDILTPLEKFQRDQRDANVPLTSQPGAARTLAEEENRLRLLARSSTGVEPSEAQKTAALTEAQKKLTGEFRDSIIVLTHNTNAQIALTTATEIGGKFLEHSINLENAKIQVQKTAVEGTKEYTRQVTELAGALDRESEAKRNIAASASISQRKDELELIHAEVELLTANVAVRNRELAAIQERQKLNIKPGETPTPQEQKSIDFAKQAADYKTYVDSVKQNTAELSQLGEEIGNTLTNAVTSPWQQGETAAMRFGKVVNDIMGDLLKEFLKLAFLNPLKNEFLGTNLPTIDNIGNVFGKKKDAPVPPDGSPLATTDGGLLGGLPIDPALNAMRVAVVSGAGGLGAPGAANDNPSGLPIPPIPPVLGGGNTSPTQRSGGLTPADIAQSTRQWQDAQDMSPYKPDIGFKPDSQGIDPGADATKIWNAGVSKGIADNAGGGPGSTSIQPYLTSFDHVVQGEDYATPRDYTQTADSAPQTTDASALLSVLGTAANGATGTSGGGAGGLPIDPSSNAMRVMVVNGGTGGGSTGGGLLGTIGSGISSLFGGGKGRSGSAPSGSSSGGGLSSLFGGQGIVGNLLDKVFGKGFYGGGGLIGSLFGGGSDAGPSGLDLSGIQSSAQDFASSLPAADSLALPGLYHVGGLIGTDLPATRSVPFGAFFDAPRYHDGLGSDEFAAILQRGERVLTANTNDRMESVLGAVAQGGGGKGSTTTNHGHTINVSVQGPMSSDSARRTGYQVGVQAAAQLNRTSQRNST